MAALDVKRGYPLAQDDPKQSSQVPEKSWEKGSVWLRLTMERYVRLEGTVNSPESGRESDAIVATDYDALHDRIDRSSRRNLLVHTGESMNSGYDSRDFKVLQSFAWRTRRLHRNEAKTRTTGASFAEEVARIAFRGLSYLF